MEKKPFIVVVGLDYSDFADLALARAFELASHEPASELHVVCMLPPVDVDPAFPAASVAPDSVEASERLRNHVSAKLREFASRDSRSSKMPGRIVSHVSVDAPAAGIAQLASDLEADLVVVGTHSRRGVHRLLMGSVAEGVVRWAPCPVLVVRPKTQAAQGPVIAPPCQLCVETRAATGGRELWCQQHRERHGRRHTYHQGDLASAETNLPLLTHPA